MGNLCSEVLKKPVQMCAKIIHKDLNLEVLGKLKRNSNKTGEKWKFALHPHSNTRRQPSPFGWCLFRLRWLARLHHYPF